MVSKGNGKSQRLQQLHIGFPGYDELQEGLAVLSEYMVGELTGVRLRLLAAHVVAARYLIDGTSFVEVFKKLNYDYGFQHLYTDFSRRWPYEGRHLPAWIGKAFRIP